MKALKISLPDKYYDLLTQADGDREWRELTLLLTTGESYFFRDRELFSLLKTRLLPGLIARKKQEQIATGATKRSLRIWSAGCSTGEEAYSLAILVKQLISDLASWDILILGTDINQAAIESAKRGIYNSWSFRKVDPGLQNQYFNQVRSDWQIDEQIRHMVNFKPGNLLKDSFPNYLDIYDMDLIICRNVFIYFDFQTVATIVKKFYQSLKPEGYFISGHAELYGQNLGNFQVQSFPESVVYERPQGLQFEKKAAIEPAEDNLTNQSFQQNSPTKSTADDSKTASKFSLLSPSSQESKFIQSFSGSSVSPFSQLLVKEENINIASEQLSHGIPDRAKKLFDNSDYANAAQELERLIQHQPHHSTAYNLLAQCYAYLGNISRATSCCDRAITLDANSLTPYYILARFAEAKGEIEEAKNLLKKAIYLDPSSISAYLKLGSIYDKEGDLSRAIKMKRNAWELLKQLPPSMAIEHSGKVTVSALLLQLKTFLEQQDNLASLS
jgi:chemotaxis protein methyltransferase CheR